MPSGPRILITAGPTHEPIDAVRYIGNRSSGRLGRAIADAAETADCPATLLLGPVTEPPRDQKTPHEAAVIRFRRTHDLQELIRNHWPAHDILIMAAAVCDFMPASEMPGKGPRRSGPVSLDLIPTPDLLQEAASTSRSDQTLIGFALEASSELEQKAREKLKRKGVHAIVANPLDTMDSDTIDGLLLLPDGPSHAPGGPLPKEAFAAWLIDRILELHAER